MQVLPNRPSEWQKSENCIAPLKTPEHHREHRKMLGLSRRRVGETEWLKTERGRGQTGSCRKTCWVAATMFVVAHPHGDDLKGFYRAG